MTRGTLTFQGHAGVNRVRFQGLLARGRRLKPGTYTVVITAAITGPRTEAHWDSYVKALDVTLDAEDEALVNRLVTEGHASTPGFNDPSHPVEGRVPRHAEPTAAQAKPPVRAIA